MEHLAHAGRAGGRRRPPFGAKRFLTLIPVGDPINDHFETVCARLAEDYGLSIADIDALDREQIYAVYFHPRDKDGRLEVKPNQSGGGLHGQFVANLRRHGIIEPEWQERFWRQWQAESKANDDARAAIASAKASEQRIKAEFAKVGRARAQHARHTKASRKARS